MKSPAAPRVREVRFGLFVIETAVEDFDVRAAVVVGAKRAVVWDTLARPSDMSVVPEIAGDRPLAVVYSHADWDHVWGTAGLGGTGRSESIEVVAHEAAEVRFATDVPETLAAKRAADPGAWDAIRLVPPTRTFATVLELPLGGVTLRLHHLPGHTPDCIVGEIPEWDVLLAGDVVEAPLPVINDAGAVGGWIAGLDRWAVTGPELVVPSHGPLADARLLARTAAYLRDLRAGGTEAPPGRLDPFYRDTHRRNVERVVGQCSER